MAEGADGCLTRDLALRATSERVGRPLFARSGAALKVVGTARAKRGGGFRVTLDLSRIGGQHLGRRTLETDAEDCSALDEAVVLALVLMLDFVDQPSVNPHGGGQSAPKSTEIHIPPDAPAPRAPWAWGIGGGLEGTSGLTPGWHGFTGGAFAAAPGGWVLAVSASVLPEAQVPRSDLHIAATTLRLTLCPWSFRTGVLRLGACASQRTAVLTGTESEVPPGREQTHTTSAFGLRLHADVLLWERLLVLISAGADLALARAQFTDVAVAGPPRDVFHTSTLSPSVALLLGVGDR